MLSGGLFFKTFCPQLALSIIEPESAWIFRVSARAAGPSLVTLPRRLTAVKLVRLFHEPFKIRFSAHAPIPLHVPSVGVAQKRGMRQCGSGSSPSRVKVAYFPMARALVPPSDLSAVHQPPPSPPGSSRFPLRHHHRRRSLRHPGSPTKAVEKERCRKVSCRGVLSAMVSESTTSPARRGASQAASLRTEGWKERERKRHSATRSGFCPRVCVCVCVWGASQYKI